MLRVGIAGIGFMGMIHYQAYGRAKGVKVVALCTRDEKKLAGDWRGIQGNFGPPGEMTDLSGVAKYRQLDELLASREVDLVDVCLPPSLHADAAVSALHAGKHVFCEKPIAVTAADAERMVAAAESSGKQLLIGQVLPFFPEYAFALATIQSGKYGPVQGGHFKRIISEPNWLKDFFDPVKVGGPAVDLHVHDAHFIRVVCGMPRAVFTTGRMRGPVAELFHTQFLFADKNLHVTAASGVINQQGRPFTHGFEIYLRDATLLFDFAVLGGEAVSPLPLTVLEPDGTVTRPQLPAGDHLTGFVAEINEVAQAIASGQPSALLNGDLARDALVLCHKQEESLRTGKLVAV
ncbi:MAG: Gfo/Idh/MocA family oxidoreductase [Planctomycetia bacterium]|nr:Gfo/Idh/MocA family oxidoreductase [Planctomycetia bacterium]